MLEIVQVNSENYVRRGISQAQSWNSEYELEGGVRFAFCDVSTVSGCLVSFWSLEDAGRAVGVLRL